MSDNARIAGRLGALRRNSIYGNPATADSRRKGGIASYKKFISNPGLAALSGFKIEKEIALPGRIPALAEFIGIILGDGSISSYQVRVYFNAKTDSLYATYVHSLVDKLFRLDSTIALRPKNTLELTISSSALVKFLAGMGLKNGSKVRQQARVPSWIVNDKRCAMACLRGLMDTDGGIYFHNHITKGIRYRNMAVCFTNRCRPLVSFVAAVLADLEIIFKNNLRDRIFIYNKAGIGKYVNSVGSHNLNFLLRFLSHNSNTYYPS